MAEHACEEFSAINPGSSHCQCGYREALHGWRTDTDSARNQPPNEVISQSIIDQLAEAAAQHGVMISITVTPYSEAEGNSDGELP